MKRLSLMKRRTTIFSIKRAKLTEKEEQEKSTKEETNNNPLPIKVYDPTKFQTFAQFIQSSTELNDLIRSQLNQEGKNCAVEIEDETFGLVGLHSCGNLSNSIINLYLNKHQTSTSNNRLLCNVACCYNLLNEKYANDLECYIDVKKTNVKIDDSSKFPMSELLNTKNYSLNFNARSLACHSLDRCLETLDDYREVFLFLFLLNILKSFFRLNFFDLS